MLTTQQATAHDIFQQQSMLRCGVRGAVMTLKPKTFAVVGLAEQHIEADFAALIANGTAAPEIAQLAARALPIARTISDHNNVLLAYAKRDQQSTLDGYNGRGSTTIAKLRRK